MVTVESTAARCALHPDLSAVATCARCGGFLCGDCLELVGEAPSCAPCVTQLQREGRPSRAVQVALGFGVLGLVLVPCSLALPLPPLVAGVGCVVVGTREVRRIRRGEGPQRGLAQANLARKLGWLILGFLGAWCAFGVWVWVHASG